VWGVRVWGVKQKRVKIKFGDFFFIFILAVSTEQSIHPMTTTTPRPVPSPPTTLDDDPVGVNDCPNRTTKKEFTVSFFIFHLPIYTDTQP
jgi:hypothetical protein